MNNQAFSILETLVNNGNQNVGKLIEELAISQPTVNKYLNQLEQEGYIERTRRDEKGARNQIIVSITPSGSKFYDAVAAIEPRLTIEDFIMLDTIKDGRFTYGTYDMVCDLSRKGKFVSYSQEAGNSLTELGIKVLAEYRSNVKV